MDKERIESKKKEDKKVNNKNKKTDKRKRQKWEPGRIYLEPVKILSEEKERLMNEIAKIIVDLNQAFNSNLAEAYDKS